MGWLLLIHKPQYLRQDGLQDTCSHPVLIPLCQSLVSILLQQWAAKVKKKQKQKADEATHCQLKAADADISALTKWD